MTSTRRPSAGPDTATSTTVEPLVLDKREAAEKLGVSVRQVERFVKRGLLKRVRFPGMREVGFRPQDLKTFVDRSTS